MTGFLHILSSGKDISTHKRGEDEYSKLDRDQIDILIGAQQNRR